MASPFGSPTWPMNSARAEAVTQCQKQPSGAQRKQSHAQLQAELDSMYVCLDWGDKHGVYTAIDAARRALFELRGVVYPDAKEATLKATMMEIARAKFDKYNANDLHVVSDKIEEAQATLHKITTQSDGQLTLILLEVALQAWSTWFQGESKLAALADALCVKDMLKEIPDTQTDYVSIPEFSATTANSPTVPSSESFVEVSMNLSKSPLLPAETPFVSRLSSTGPPIISLPSSSFEDFPDTLCEEFTIVDCDLPSARLIRSRGFFEARAANIIAEMRGQRPEPAVPRKDQQSNRPDSNPTCTSSGPAMSKRGGSKVIPAPLNLHEPIFAPCSYAVRCSPTFESPQSTATSTSDEDIWHQLADEDLASAPELDGQRAIHTSNADRAGPADDADLAASGYLAYMQKLAAQINKVPHVTPTSADITSAPRATFTEAIDGRDVGCPMK